MITLFGRRNSINVQKVLWTLDEIGLAYEHVDAGGDVCGLDDPAFRAMNPHGKVPVLMDGETAIWESNAIIRYLCAACAPGSIAPVAPLERAHSDGWMDWTATILQPAIMGLFWGFWRTPADRRDDARVAGLVADAAQAIRTLDRWLEARRFIAGDDLTMADIPAGTLMFRYFGMGVETPAAPAAQAWRARLAERPAYRTHVMRPFDELHGRLAF